MGIVVIVLAALAPYLHAVARVETMSPRQKAALLVVSSPPVPRGVRAVLVHSWETDRPRPPRALVFVDQEGGSVRAYQDLPPERAARDYTRSGEAFAAGRATGRALHRVGVLADLAPVLDAPDGPLGSRQFRRPALAVAFARGLRAGGVIGCAKHFPGLGSTAESTDSRHPVRGTVRAFEVAGFASAFDAGVPCVMVSHAIYGRFGPRPASISRGAYRLLRGLGFRGVAITDELGVLGHARAAEWGRRAVLAGADLVLYSSPEDASRALEALVPLARTQALDPHAARVLLLRASVGL